MDKRSILSSILIKYYLQFLYCNIHVAPEMWDLINIVIPKVKASWVELAYSMGYSVNDVRGFERDGRSLDEQCRKLFEDWLTTGRGCTPKTWQTLLKQIRQVNDLTAAAEEIEKELINCKE